VEDPVTELLRISWDVWRVFGLSRHSFRVVYDLLI
jgi:hypothetical protein